ncbi:MAG: methyltransferase domain-containing protein [Acidimicrobiales bacterium]
MTDVYTHGHHPSVVASHEWRTAENSAAYLLPRLRPGDRLLDVGCGPGTITVDLAARVAPGPVVGLDRDAGVVARARAHQAGQPGVGFVVGDLYRCGLADRAVDVVHAHQVLQHLSRPVDALVELRRVTRPGGTLAVRDGDYGAFAWAPADPLLSRWLDLYHGITARNGAEADAGRHLPGWVRAAGWRDPVVTSSTWTFADPASCRWWGGSWAQRVTRSAFAEQAERYGLSDRAELAAIAAAWRRWAEAPDAVFVTPHVEVLARR